MCAAPANSVSSSKEAAQPLDRRRWLILGLLLAITTINFIDRQTLSVLAPQIRENLHLSRVVYGRIAAAFQFGMMSGEFPMAWIMDRWGVRLGMAGAVIWWSVATGLHGFVRSGFSLGFLRYWMGTGECGNYSGGVKAVGAWFPASERAFAVGFFNSGSMIGAIVAPPLVVFLAQRRLAAPPPNVGDYGVPFSGGSGGAVLLVLDFRLPCHHSPYDAFAKCFRHDRAFCCWWCGFARWRAGRGLAAEKRRLDSKCTPNYDVCWGRAVFRKFRGLLCSQFGPVPDYGGRRSFWTHVPLGQHVRRSAGYVSGVRSRAGDRLARNLRRPIGRSVSLAHWDSGGYGFLCARLRTGWFNAAGRRHGAVRFERSAETGGIVT